MTLHLDKEELALEQAFERENITTPFLSSEELKKEKLKLKKYKVAKPEKRGILIRLLLSDIVKLKAKAESIGIPYQTYIISELHKVANKTV
ncbi:MAG: hypothetical protein CR971_00810 [candidate division SR1 bacterium]|nr:MAG: hypothetical protein CR971_00810 [candidate division SR1 bacterium]